MEKEHEQSKKKAKAEIAVADKVLHNCTEQLGELDGNKAKLAALREELEAVVPHLEADQAALAEVVTSRDCLRAKQKRQAKAVGSAGPDACAWLFDWTRVLGTNRREVSWTKRAVDKREEALKNELAMESGRQQDATEYETVTHMAAVEKAHKVHAAQPTLQPGAHAAAELAALALVEATDAEASATLAAAEDGQIGSSRAAAEDVAECVRARDSLVGNLKKEVMAKVDGAEGQMLANKTELELRIAEWKRQALAFQDKGFKAVTHANVVAAAIAALEDDKAAQIARGEAARRTAEDCRLRVEEMEEKAKEHEREWVAKLDGMRETLTAEKRQLEYGFGERIKKLREELEGWPPRVLEAEAALDAVNAQLEAKRAGFTSTQSTYDSTLSAYDTLRESFLRIEPKIKHDESVGELDSTILQLASRVLEQEFVSYEQSLRDLCR